MSRGNIRHSQGPPMYVVLGALDLCDKYNTSTILRSRFIVFYLPIILNRINE